MKPDHGSDTGGSAARFGQGAWIDLSTAINRRPWPLGDLPPQVWRALPTAAARDRLIATAAAWFGCPAAQVLPVAGASAAIRMIPRLLPTGRAAVIAPSHDDHAASLGAAGWQVSQFARPEAMEGADLAVVVNPNNPDGREWPPEVLARLARRVGHLVVDESFADVCPDLSLAPALPPNVLVLRSFSPFWGLAGLRLGFVLARPDLLGRLSDAAGPWAVNGPALHVGAQAMADRAWADATVLYHAEAALRLDRLAIRAGWRPAGGTHLFRLYDTGDAAAAQERLARAHVWTRRFSFSRTWLRMGIPGGHEEWDRLTDALRKI
ncbi:threonine-phosphate decarboxylase CobD [Paracoccus sp. SY]|uniref:threonine-phosphate decarboxylase CobD n=1 Tax=Paracoccus sp. SY TaxID=1330255 RepID=UPI000CD08C50|nr:threonine-phosphate decarboxylase CobD [Paracoccus sp. SY]